MLGKRKISSLLMTAALLLTMAGAGLAGDKSGAQTLREDPGSPADFVWTLVAAFLVFLMQAGFACLEGGFTRSKNAINIMMKNLLDFSMGSLGFWLVGFALMFGGSALAAGLDRGNWFWGYSGFFLSGGAYDVKTFLYYMFHLVFCATAATIVSGAMAERTRFHAYLICSFFITAIIYPIYGHWLWGGGWLNQAGWMKAITGTGEGGYGALDFAGSSVVHVIGGFVGLAGAIVLGPRLGKYNRDGTPNPIPGHSMPMAALGVFILWFGWFGFNPGSTTSAHELRISVIAVNTNLAAAAGAIFALFTVWTKTKKPDIGMTLNGAVAGLVAITAPCAWVDSIGAVIIGAVAGILVVLSCSFFEERGVDDPVGAISAHGSCGVWGLISLGLFADGSYGNYTTDPPYVTGLFYGGGAGQLAAQAISAIACAAWAFVTGYILFKTIAAAVGLRVSEEEELGGLDLGEHGSTAYPDFRGVATWR